MVGERIEEAVDASGDCGLSPSVITAWVITRVRNWWRNTMENNEGLSNCQFLTTSFLRNYVNPTSKSSKCEPIEADRVIVRECFCLLYNQSNLFWDNYNHSRIAAINLTSRSLWSLKTAVDFIWGISAYYSALLVFSENMGHPQLKKIVINKVSNFNENLQ